MFQRVTIIVQLHILLLLMVENYAVVAGLLCQDCVEPCRHGGICRTDDGKCFVRRDVNNMVYRGCADKDRWSGLNITTTPCSLQSYLGWDNLKVLWCLCDTFLCNKQPITSFQNGAELLRAFIHNNSNIFIRKHRVRFDRTRYTYLQPENTDDVQHVPNSQNSIPVTSYDSDSVAPQTQSTSFTDDTSDAITDDFQSQTGRLAELEEKSLPIEAEAGDVFRDDSTYIDDQSVVGENTDEPEDMFQREFIHETLWHDDVRARNRHQPYVAPQIVSNNDVIHHVHDVNINNIVTWQHRRQPSAFPNSIDESETESEHLRHNNAIYDNAENMDFSIPNDIRPNHELHNNDGIERFSKNLPDDSDEMLIAENYSKDQLTYPEGAFINVDDVVAPHDDSHANELAMTSHGYEFLTESQQAQVNAADDVAIDNHEPDLSTVGASYHTSTDIESEENGDVTAELSEGNDDVTAELFFNISYFAKQGLPTIDHAELADEANVNDHTEDELTDEVYVSDHTEDELADEVDVTASTDTDDETVRTETCGDIIKPDDRCPNNFHYVTKQGSCYAVVRDAMNYTDAQVHCDVLYKGSTLVTIGTEDELRCVASWVDSSSMLLDGWQGWWTGARYDVRVREFTWSQTGSVISRRDSRWLPSLVVYPYDATCVWLVPLSQYSLGNYWCAEESGFICETDVIT